MAIVGLDVFHNGLDQLRHAAESLTPDALLGDLTKPTLHLIEPGRARRGEVEMGSGTTAKPGGHLWGFVGAVIIEHQVDVEMGWNLFVDGGEEAQELLMAMLTVAAANDFAGGNVEGGKERSRAMSEVIVGGPFRLTGFERQKRLVPNAR